jgi:hypothetical protein
VGRPFGKITLALGLEELAQAVEDFEGALNQQAMKLPVEIPEKPEAMILDEQIRSSGLPLMSGGIMDQPYITMKEIQTVRNVRELYAFLRKQQEEALRKQNA